jgi:di/tricarboxylate transporter
VQAGDVLLLDTGAQFWDNHKNNRNFALVAEVANSHPPRLGRVVIAVLAAVVAISAAIAGLASLFASAAVASAVMLLTGCLSGDAARKAVKWDVLVTIAAAFGISTALEKTGVLCCFVQITSAFAAECFCSLGAKHVLRSVVHKLADRFHTRVTSTPKQSSKLLDCNTEL